MLAVLLSLAWADPSTGQVIIEATDSRGCSIAMDGMDMGPLPVHALKATAGTHQFSLTCPDGRTAKASSEVVLVPGGIARLILTDLPYTAAIPETVTGPIPAYVLLSHIQGERVRIDGGEPLPLPTKLNLTVGPHSFVIIDPNGTERPAVTREVVSKNHQAVVKLD